jgi:hypothetical protein
MMTSCRVNDAVQPWLHSGAMAVRESDRSTSRNTWPSMSVNVLGIANATEPIDCMCWPLGNVTVNCGVALMRMSAGRSDSRISVSVAPESARVGMMGFERLGAQMVGLLVDFTESTQTSGAPNTSSVSPVTIIGPFGIDHCTGVC